MRKGMGIGSAAVMLIVFALALVLPTIGLGGVPNQISYQGFISDEVGDSLDGDYTMVFAIYDVSTGGTALWWEEQTVTIADGIYNVQIGQDPVGNPFPADLFESQRWLGVAVGADLEMIPRLPLTSVPFALQAGGTTVGAITAVMLADEAVTEAKVADGAITAAKIVGGTDSGLDSDMLDGHDTAFFATAVHNHDSRYYTKDDVDQLIQSYESRISALEAKLAKLTISSDGKQMYITGANLHIRNSSGFTGGVVDGLGNLIIGYNATRDYYSCSLGSIFTVETTCKEAGGEWQVNSRSGSHNLIVGDKHNYSSYGGIVFGNENWISGAYASIVGGRLNIASHQGSTVSGGHQNSARGVFSSVSGGRNNRAEGFASSVSGGGSVNQSYGNIAYADYSSILGGIYNIAGDSESGNHTLGQNSTISGGDTNKAAGTYASIGGGKTNTASGFASSISGGRNNIASGQYSFIGGGGGEQSDDGNKAISHYSAILGGVDNFTGDIWTEDPNIGVAATISGGYSNEAGGERSSVSGGMTNRAIGTNSWVGGGWWNESFGYGASISGGQSNDAYGDYSSISGGRANQANGDSSSVSGGAFRSVSSEYNWGAGSLFEAQ